MAAGLGGHAAQYGGHRRDRLSPSLRVPVTLADMDQDAVAVAADRQPADAGLLDQVSGSPDHRRRPGGSIAGERDHHAAPSPLPNSAS